MTNAAGNLKQGSLDDRFINPSVYRQRTEDADSIEYTVMFWLSDGVKYRLDYEISLKELNAIPSNEVEEYAKSKFYASFDEGSHRPAEGHISG